MRTVTSQSRRLHFRLLACCLLTYAVLVLTLERQSIWWDEGISLHLAGLPWREIVRDRAANIHPPLYFFLLKVWTGAVGRTPFTGRFLSTLGTTLLPAAAYRFLGRRVGRRAGRAAAFLVAGAPPFVVYGQETRAYALLPLGVLALWSLVWPPGSGRPAAIGRHLPQRTALQVVPASRRARPRLAPATLWRGALLGVVQVVLVGLHYSGAIAVAVAAAGYGVRWLRGRRDGTARLVLVEWATGAAVTLLLAAPWIAALAAVGLLGLTSQAGIGNVLAEPIPAGYVADMLGIFHTIGLPKALGARELVRVGELIRDLALLVGLVVLLRARRRSSLVGLLLLWLVPFAAAPAIWSWSPQSHPRYLFAFVLGGWMVSAALLTHRRAPRVLAVGLLAGLLLSNMMGLRTYLYDPAYARSDVRGVADYLRERVGPGDVVLVPATDPSLEQYDVGAAVVVRAPTDATLMEPTPFGAVHPSRTIYAMDYARDALDPRDVLRTSLAWSGGPVAKEQFHGVSVERWDMFAAPELATCEPMPPVCAAGQGLCLVGTALKPQPISGGAAPVVLCWEHREPLASDIPVRLSVSLRLRGPAGDQVSMRDDALLDSGLRPTTFWGDQEVVTYHLLPVPVGAVPEPHTVGVGIYDPSGLIGSVSLIGEDGRSRSAIDLGEVVPVIAPWLETSLFDARSLPVGLGVTLPDGLRLEGARIEGTSVNPGGSVFVSVSWHADGDTRVASRPGLELWIGDQVLSEAKSTVAFDRMPGERPLLETLALPVSPDAIGGTAEVVLVYGSTRVVVGTIKVLGEVHVYDVPDVGTPVEARAGDVASLLRVGLCPETTLKAGDPLTLTLVWRAGPAAADHDLKVFTHLVSSSGEIIAQHDGLPAEWLRPTTGWLPDEIIIDAHVMTWLSDVGTTVAPGETVTIRVGLYDGGTGERVMWENGLDYLRLQRTLTIAGGVQ